MPFCVNCGNEYSTGSKFCNYCGAPTDNTSGQLQTQQLNQYVGNSVQSYLDERNNNLAELAKMYDYFMSYRKKYERFLFLTNKLLHGYTFIPALVFGCIILNVFIIVLFFGSLGRDPVAVIVSLIGIPIGAGLIVLFILGTLDRNKKRKKLVEEKDDVLDELWNHYISYGPCLLGFEYTFPETLDEIQALLMSGRANNIKEAINIMLDDNHKRQMESIATATAKYAARTASNTGIAAAATVASFFM